MCAGETKNRLGREELDALVLSAPEARAAYEAARLASQVGKQLRTSREAARLTLTEVARLAGVDENKLGQLECGEGVHDLALVVLERLALVFGRRVRVQLVEADG